MAVHGNIELKFELRAKYRIPLYYEGKDLGLVGLGFSVQYRGKPSRAVGSCLAQHTLKKLPFQPLKEFWKRVKRSC